MMGITSMMTNIIVIIKMAIMKTPTAFLMASQLFSWTLEVWWKLCRLRRHDELGHAGRGATEPVHVRAVSLLGGAPVGTHQFQLGTRRLKMSEFCKGMRISRLSRFPERAMLIIALNSQLHRK